MASMLQIKQRFFWLKKMGFWLGQIGFNCLRLILFSIKWLVITLLAILICMLITNTISCGIIKITYNKFIRTQPFDAQKWQAASKPGKAIDITNEIFTRCYMHRDLVKNQLHFDMSYDEVTKILGVPMSTDYFTNPKSKIIDYDLGECTYCCLCPNKNTRGYLLYLQFDEKAKLIGFGYGDILKEKKEVSIMLKNSKELFTCYARGSTDAKCARHVKDEIWLECPISEVKEKWGYEVW